MISIKYINLSNLPRFNIGNNKGKIDWVSSIGHYVDFTYDDISGKLLIKDYNKTTFYVTIEYNNKISNIYVSNLKLCRIGKLFGFGEYKFNIGDIVDTKSGKFKILKLTTKFSKNSKYTDKAYLCECLNCGYHKVMREHCIIAGNGCPRCSDGVSYPEKYVIEMFTQLNIKFQIQKIFKWSGKKRYDIYIPDINTIVEVNGIQHYLDEDVKIEDAIKKKLALSHNIKNYIYIDARKSQSDYISRSIKKSLISQMYNLNNINWSKCDLQACSSYIKNVCADWNNNMTTIELSEKYHICVATVQRYLRIGNVLNLCIYDKHINMKHRPINTKKVMCVNTGKIFNSQKEAAQFYSIYKSGVSDCCTGRIPSAGKFNGESLKWKFVD